jgi:SOS-response transcriptional repressor LexA
MANIDNILERLKNAKKIKTDTDLAELLGVKPNTVSGWRARKSIPYELIISFCDKEGVDVDWVFKGGAGGTEEERAAYGSDIVNIPVYTLAGAGTPKELFEGEPIAYIPISRSKFRPGLTSLIIAGESMEPTMKNGAEALIDREDHDIVDGRVYVVYIKDNGIVLKRLYRGAGVIILRSDNPASPEIVVKPEDIVVQGRVVGVSQEM